MAKSRIQLRTAWAATYKRNAARFIDMPLRSHRIALIFVARGLPRGDVRVNGYPHCLHCFLGLPAAEPIEVITIYGTLCLLDGRHYSWPMYSSSTCRTARWSSWM